MSPSSTGAIAAFGILILGTGAGYQDPFGAEDDFAGTMVTSARWLEATGQITEHNHAVILGNHRDGTATLTYRTTYP